MKTEDILFVYKVYNDIGSERINKKEISRAYTMITDNYSNDIVEQVSTISGWARNNKPIIQKELCNDLERFKYVMGMYQLAT